MVSFLTLWPLAAIATMGGIFVGVIIWDGSHGFIPYLSLSGSSYDISLTSCDNIKILLSDFNSFSHSLDMVTNGVDTRTDIPVNNNTKEIINYWLHGTPTNTNWFDKSFEIGWDYVKSNCNIISTDDSKEIINYWLYGTATENNWFDASCYWCGDYVKNIYNVTQIGSYLHEASSEQLELTSESNYFVYGLGWFLIVCVMFFDFYLNFDTLYAVFTHVDVQMYNFLCLFDFPGFLVNSNTIMNLGPSFDFQVEHNWKFRTDPGDGMLRLCHMVTYSLIHEYFWFQFNLLSPSWSVLSYLTLTIVPGLDWPLNYDRHRIFYLFGVA